MNFPGFLKVAYRDKFIEEENWSRTNADGFDFFENLKVTSEPEYITKALLLIKKHCPEMLKKTGATNKSNAKSAATREKANKLFQKKKWTEALKNYSKSIALAEVGSTELGFAYANRSALLLHRGFYKEALEDIDRALNQDYPADKKPQLITRKDKAKELAPTQKKSIIQEIIPPLSTQSESLPGATQAVELAEDETYGHYIQATRKIVPGEVILVEDPYSLAVGQEFKTTHCGDCGNLCYNPIPCRNCSIEMYCTEKCKDKAYKQYHQYECVVLNYYPSKVFNIADIPAEERNISEINKEQIRQLALRITLKGFRSYVSASDDPENIYEEIGKLQTHRDDLSKSALMVLSFNLAKQFQILKKDTNFMSKLLFKDKEDIFKYHLLRNRLICCFNLGTLQYKLDEMVNGQTNCSPAIGLYRSYSRFNHACAHNVAYGYYGHTIVVRAIRTIEKGEQCFLNYGHFFHEHHKLQRVFCISRNYLFTCKCVACVDEWKTLDEITEAKDNLKGLNSSALTLIETTRLIIQDEKLIEEDVRQQVFQQCAIIESIIKNDGCSLNLIMLYNLMHLISVLRYPGSDF